MKKGNLTLFITNDGAIWYIFFKAYKTEHLGQMFNCVHLENVRKISVYSYAGSIHLGKMYNFVHLAKMTIAAKAYTVFVTYMLVMYFYLVHHNQKNLLIKFSPSPPTPPMPQHT
jgi:hypothetical protein